MEILVIGRNGQLARALGEELPRALRLGRKALDLRDTATTERFVREHHPDVVVNAAAYTDVERAEDEVAAAYAINSHGVAALARGSAAVGAALIHISTDYVFDGRKVGGWTETDGARPHNVYGATKLAGEEAALAANRRTLVLRTSWLYAPWGRNFVTTMLRLADRERVSVVSDQHGSPTSALSLARAVRFLLPLMAQAPATSSLWGIWHYAGRGVTSWAGFAQEIFGQAQGRLVERIPEVVPITTAEYPARATRPLNSVLDCTAFEQEFGIAMVDWRKALSEVISRLATEREKQ